MIVVQIHMWPSGRRERARLLSTAALDLQGVALRDDAKEGVKRGERAYRVRVFRDAQFGGPGAEATEQDLARARVWREAYVRGHIPGVGRRGTWDLLGGALGVVLRGRLGRYVSYQPPAGLPPVEPPELDDRASIVAWLRSLARHRACPPERVHWYEGVADDIEQGADAPIGAL